MPSNASRAARLCIVLGLIAPLAAFADWKRDYALALDAVEAGDWARAETLLRSAIAEDGNPSARKRFQGTVFKSYVPHYYAGLAAWRQGKCEVALQYWRNPASVAVVAQMSELEASQRRGIAECSTRLASTPPPANSPAGASRPGASATAPGTAPASVPPSAPNPARPAPAVAAQGPAPPPAARPGPPTPSPASAPPSASRPAPAPAALVTVVEHFLSGRYDAVLQFDPASLGEGRSRAQAFLFRAAARHIKSELTGGDARALQLAQQDVRAARSANASLTPDPVLFSPRFRAFWQQQR